MLILVPIYDATTTKISIPETLVSLDRALPKYKGSVPPNSLVLVGYTVSFYKGDYDVHQSVSNNIAWVIVIGSGEE